MNRHWPRGLYAITPDEADTALLLDRVEAGVRAGPHWLRARNKRAGSDICASSRRRHCSRCAVAMGWR